MSSSHVSWYHAVAERTTSSRVERERLGSARYRGDVTSHAALLPMMALLSGPLGAL
jgi:hypothetical protein